MLDLRRLVFTSPKKFLIKSCPIIPKYGDCDVKTNFARELFDERMNTLSHDTIRGSRVGCAPYWTALHFRGKMCYVVPWERKEKEVEDSLYCCYLIKTCTRTLSVILVCCVKHFTINQHRPSKGFVELSKPAVRGEPRSIGWK